MHPKTQKSDNVVRDITYWWNYYTIASYYVPNQCVGINISGKYCDFDKFLYRLRTWGYINKR